MTTIHFADGETAYQLIMVNEQCLALPVTSILGIFPLENVLKLPDSPDWLSGVTHLRNAIVPVMDLQQLLGLAGQALCHFIVLLQNPQSAGRWLAVAASDIGEVLDKARLMAVTDDRPRHIGIKQLVQDSQQTICLLDIGVLFDYVVIGQDKVND